MNEKRRDVSNEIRRDSQRSQWNPDPVHNAAHSNRDIAVGSLYVQREALGDPPPHRLKVTIEPEEGL